MPQPSKNNYVGDAKILLYDLETTNLKADFGTILCIGYKWYNEDYIYCPSITDYAGWKKDPSDCKKLLKLLTDFKKVWDTADIVVSYFGKGFDMKFLNAKTFEYDMEPLRQFNGPSHVDCFYTVKGTMALSRKSLQNVGYVGGFSAEKTPVEGKIWRRAATGHAPSIKYIIDHCYADIELLEEAYDRLKPYMKQHPRVSGYGPCRQCGSTKLEGRGYLVTQLKGKVQRIHCNNCGAWDQRSPEKDHILALR
jgi:uncharacterized protein YprB with RNaseH-like and TPR domain